MYNLYADDSSNKIDKLKYIIVKTDNNIFTINI